ncbi:MAG: hypothetical protein GY822_01640 [Deltaproteobacteria bacterium]|nr:hypothetical protein [Deltaproteobacteria bacterium]
MFNTLYALIAGLAAAALSYFAVGPWGAVLPFIAVFTGLFIFLWRRTNKQVEVHFAAVQKEMAKGKAQNIDRAIQMMKDIKVHFAKRQFFLGSAINGQIGSLLFMQSKFEDARPFLENAYARAWEPQAMLAVLQYKKKDMAGVDVTFERAAKLAAKAGLMWSTWAWMHHKAGNKDKALQILVRGKEALGDKDPYLSANVLALQNNKKLKMKPYGQQWYVFMLEQPALQRQAARGNVRYGRR